MRHYNPSITEDVNRIFNTKGIDPLSDEIKEISAVVEIEPPLRIIRAVSTTATGGATLFTTPTDKDFYLKNIIFSFIKDAACDVPTGVIPLTVQIDGVTVNLISISVITLTQQNETLEVDFSKAGVKLDRNSLVRIASVNFAAGVLIRAANLIGYTVETTRT